MTDTPCRAAEAPTAETVRRRDRRRRHLRGRRRLSPDQAVPRHELRRARSAGKLRRHLAHPSLSRASAPTATSTPSATASSRGPARRSRPPPRSCSYMGEVIDENDLARHIRYRHQITRRRWSSARQPLDHRGARAPTPARRVRFTANFLWMCQGYYRHSRGLHARVAGHGRLQGPDRPPADLARGSRLRRQEGRRHRLGRHGGDADPGDRRRLRARHDAAALADLFPHRPQRDRRSPTSCASWRSTRRWIHEIVRRKILHEQAIFTRRSFDRAGDGQAGTAGRRARPSRPRLRHRRPTSRRATGPGASASPSCPTAICSQAIQRRQGLGRHRRDRDASPRAASC